jgi:hypothetical protein
MHLHAESGYFDLPLEDFPFDDLLLDLLESLDLSFESFGVELDEDDPDPCTGQVEQLGGSIGVCTGQVEHS